MFKQAVGLFVAFAIGVGITATLIQKPEVITIVKRETKEIPFFDFTIPKEDLQNRVEAAANFLGWSLYKYDNLQDIKDEHRRNKQEIEDIYREKEYNLRKNESVEYSRGYKTGFRDGMQVDK